MKVIKVVIAVGVFLLILGAILLGINKPVQSTSGEPENQTVQETQEELQLEEKIEESPLEIIETYKGVKDPSQSYVSPIAGGRNDTDGPGEFQPEEPKIYDYVAR